MRLEDKVKIQGELIEALEAYIKLLGEELNDVMPLYVIHGDVSTRVESGKFCRDAIARIKEKLTPEVVTKEVVKVICLGGYRDGGTIEYLAQDGKLYYMWNPTKEVFSVMPKVARKEPNYVPLPIILEVVERF